MTVFHCVIFGLRCAIICIFILFYKHFKYDPLDNYYVNKNLFTTEVQIKETDTRLDVT